MIGHLLVRYLLQCAVPELGKEPRWARNLVYSDLENVETPDRISINQFLVTWPPIVVVSVGFCFGVSHWLMGLAIGVVLAAAHVARYAVAKQHVVLHVRRRLLELERLVNPSGPPDV